MKKLIALDLHIAMFTSDIISCVRVIINSFIQGLLQLITSLIALRSVF